MMSTFYLLLMSLFFCNAPADTEESTASITLLDGYDFCYSLKEPDQTFKMPKDLEEISGLGISEDGETLVAIQDEDGKLFIISRYTGEVVNEIGFWKDGDYEGVEMVGSTAYVVKSSGTLYEVTNPGALEQEVEKYNFFLDDSNDAWPTTKPTIASCWLVKPKRDTRSASSTRRASMPSTWNPKR